MTAENSTSEAGRISVLETLQEQTELTGARFERSFIKIQTSLDRMADRLSEVGKPQWNTLASWAAVVIIFIGLVGGSVIGNVISNQDRIEKAMLEHHNIYHRYIYKTANEDGRQTEKISSLERALALLYETQKKDMDIYRESHATLKEDLQKDIANESENLDIRMQRELNDRLGPVEKKLDIIEERFYDNISKK